MKTLSLARPLVIIMVGLPGSGKSFFARQFSEMFSSPLVSHDRVRFELFDKPQLSPQENDIVQRLTHYQASELVKTHRSFIIDGGTSTRNERLNIEQFAKAHGYGTLAIWVQTDEVTCRQRATKRNPRRTDDKYSPSLSESQWTALAKRFTPPAKEPYMVISGKHAFSTQARMVLRKLTTPHVEEAETAHKEERKQAVRTSPRPVRRREQAAAPRRNVVIS